VEFEYWAENPVEYSSFFNYCLLGLLGFGALMCSCFLLSYKGSIEEIVTTTKSKMWKLKNKSREYIDSNAPGVYEMIKTA